MVLKVLKLAKTTFSSQTGKDTSIVFVTTIVNIIVGGLFFILVPRLLDTASYGIFSTVLATGIMASSIANLGIDTSLLHYVSKNTNEKNKFLSLALESYLVIALVVTFTGFFLSAQIAAFLNTPQTADLLKIAFLSTTLLLLVNFYTASLQSQGKFLKASLLNIISNSIRLLSLLAAFYFFTVNLYFLTFLFFFVTVSAVIAGRIFMPFNFNLIPPKGNSDLFKFNSWIALALIVSSVPFDNYFLIKLAGPVQTALYAAPFKILAFSYQIGGNLTRVLGARFSSAQNLTDVKKYSFEFLPFPILISLGLVVLAIFPHFFIQVLFGNQYLESAQVLRILSIGSISFFLNMIPASIILYHLSKPKVSMIITLARYVLFVALLFMLVPQYLALGAAYAFTISETFVLVLMSAYLLKKFSAK